MEEEMEEEMNGKEEGKGVGFCRKWRMGRRRGKDDGKEEGKGVGFAWKWRNIFPSPVKS